MKYKVLKDTGDWRRLSQSIKGAKMILQTLMTNQGKESSGHS